MDVAGGRGKLSILSGWGLKGPLTPTGKAFSGEGITEGKTCFMIFAPPDP